MQVLGATAERSIKELKAVFDAKFSAWLLEAKSGKFFDTLRADKNDAQLAFQTLYESMERLTDYCYRDGR